MTRTVVLLGLLGAALGVALRFVDALATMPLSTVRVQGELTAAESDQVRAAVTAELARPGWRGAGAVARAVRDLPWVREVRVRRHWPDLLHVAVTHQTVAARWGEDAWLATGGSVLSAPRDPGDPRLRGLPSLRAAVSDGRRAMQVFDMLNGAARAAGLRIARLEESDAGDWAATLADGPTVVLGAAHLAERFARFLAVHRSVLRGADRLAERVDARYHTGVAVRWGQASATAAGIGA